jgi:hypothetical protein
MIHEMVVDMSVLVGHQCWRYPRSEWRDVATQLGVVVVQNSSRASMHHSVLQRVAGAALLSPHESSVLMMA